jgi:uncharacterized protein (TIGR01777 family)
MRVFVTGGTGLVGKLLVKNLSLRGDQVVLLTRRPEAARQQGGAAVTIVAGDPAQPGPWMDAVKDCDAVVHLAGEGIFNRRWSSAFKELLYSSRIKSTDNIVSALGKSPVANAPGSPGRVLVNASAIGYYGPHGDEELTEESGPGHDFLAKLCIDWEKAAQVAVIHGVRVVLLRTGIVLDQQGGALAKMLLPFKMGVGGPIGSGTQFMSWIHIEDEVGLILFALDHPQLDGPLNATAPNPATNKAFGNALGKVLGRPSFMPTPAFALRVMLGESAQLITAGQRVLPKKALAAGYAFKYPELEPALRDLLGNRGNALP